MKDNKLNINKTKYRYLMDNLKLFPIRPIITYTIPVPNDPTVDESKQEFFDRKYPDVKITNLHFKHMIDKTAKALVAYGVKKGDIVTICQTNTPEMFYMDYALSKIGAKANFIYPNVTAEEMKYYMEELDSKYMFILDDDPIRKNVKEATKGTDIKIISSSVIEAFPELFKRVASKKMPKNKVELDNEIKWKEFIENGKEVKEVKENPYKPGSTFSFIHTSGTSNIPKAVETTNKNVNVVPRNYEIDGIEMKSGKVLVQTIPNFVQFGNTGCHVAFCNNTNVVIIPEMDPKNYWDLIHNYKPVYSYATPSHARELIKRPTNMKNAKNYLFGGDTFDDVEPKLNKFFKENGSISEAYQGYGATEDSAFNIINRPGAHKVGSIGKLCGNIEYQIIEPGTFNVISEPNVVGELCLTGEQVTKGYAGNSKDQNAEIFVKHPDGKIYVHMGDFVSRDEEGFFYFHGRKKNVITRKSFTFSPEEIVNAIKKHPNVKQCVVVPRYSEAEGETPSAHITLNDYSNVDLTLNEIIKLVNDNVQEFHRPTDYKIRENIMVTRNNKININALKIEDSISMFDGVVSANINISKDGNYDYSVDVIINENILNAQDFETQLDKHLRRISKMMKFNIGTIKYNISYIDKFIDKDKNLKNFKNYVKHM